MYFLSKLTDSIQAAMAVLTAVIAYFTYHLTIQSSKQEVKIRDLAKIAEEMQKQTRELDRRFQLELSARLNTVIPILKYGTSFIPDGERKLVIVLINIGCEAIKVASDESIDAPFNVYLRDQEAVPRGRVELEVEMKSYSEKLGFDFNIISTAVSGASCKQRVLKNEKHDTQVGIPELAFSSP